MAEQDPLRPPADGSKMTRVSRTAAFWLLFVLMVVLLVQLTTGQEEAAIDFTYTEFKTQLDADNILEVTVVASQLIEGELRAPRIEEGREFQNFETMLPGEITEELLTDLVQRNVVISGQLDTRGWGSVLVQVLPWVLFIAFWIWILRTFQGGGNRAFQFGRSKAKMISPEAPKVTFADIAAADPSSIPAPSESLGLRAFNFVPDTDRLSGSLRVDTKIGRAAVQGGGFITHLRQTNRAPLQRALELDRQQVTSWSAHGGFELALDHDLELMGPAKFSERRNGLDVNDLAGQQLGPILRRRSELDTRLELSLRPQAGARVATGYRYEWIDRNLRYPEALLAVDEPVALITGRSESHNLYLRGRARLFRRLQVSGELGWEYRPQRDYPRDMTHSVYFDARGAYTLLRPIPISLSLQGGVRDGHGNGRVLTGSASQACMDLDRLQWSYSATLTAVPASSTTLTLSFVQHQDDQETPYLRTDFPRTFGSGFTNFLPNPERVHYDSGVRSLSLGGRQKLTDSLEMRGFANLTWVEADIEGNNLTGAALDGVNEIRSRILSAGGGETVDDEVQLSATGAQCCDDALLDLPTIDIDDRAAKDALQVAVGVFSPVDSFTGWSSSGRKVT